ncbi:Urease operon transcriptional activator (plasmid) [Variovorax sp. PBL-E5]|nr:AraC family transcriptional regulator [Variovorax sp. PBL-E5]VTU45103.1 Urease operon transcriptional activator [Variovorax sp. PBL-E5]
MKMDGMLPVRHNTEGDVELVRSEAFHGQPGALAIVTALSQALFILVLRAHAQREGMPASLLVLLVLLGDPRLSRVVLAMLQHPERPWPVANLADQAMMSRATFARHFASRGATSPLELLTLLRMQVARDLLARGQMSTADVAERVGYASESAFGKAFAQRMGVTPAAFRRQSRRPG